MKFHQALFCLICTTASSHAALTVELHPDTNGNVIVKIVGSGTTGDNTLSSFTNGLTFGEQWANMTDNPFDDVLNPDNFDLFFDTPLLIQQVGATEVFITGIQIDNDATGPDQDDFRIYVSGDMLANTAYSIDGVATVTPTLSFDNLTPGTYTDDTDGGTAFLGGFQLVVDNTVIPEPSTAMLALTGCMMFGLRRRR